MNKPKPILNKLTLLLLVFIALTAIIIESCKKDNHIEQQTSAIDPAVAQAKSWYESTYPVSSTKVTTQANGTNADLSQISKPDWQHNSSYTRFNKKVIELPLDPSSKFNPAIKNMTTAAAITADVARAISGTVWAIKNMTTGRSSNSAYSRSSFILINNGNGYDAYVMTLIADSAYLKNDRSKLDRNKYNKRDVDYSGLVLYFTPKGKYIGGWRYKDGHIVLPGNRDNSSGVKVQSVGTSRVKTMSEDCYDYNLVAYTNGRVDYEIYMFTICSSGGPNSPGNGPGDIGGDGGGGGGGSGPGDGGPSSATPPPPCNSAVHPGPVPIINSSGKLIVNDVPPDGGDGFPPPQGPCYIETLTDITNNVTDPCLKSMVNSTINADITSQINTLIQKVFGGTEKINLKFVDNVPLNSGVEGHTEMNGGFDANGNLNIVIQLNKNELPHYSQQYIATVIMHESLHAYLESKGVDPKNQHENIIIDYVTKMAASLQQMFPGLEDADAKNLSLGGLDQTTTFLYTVARDMQLSGDFAATQSAYSIGSLGTRCK
jgi:hypothetical protein